MVIQQFTCPKMAKWKCKFHFLVKKWYFFVLIINLFYTFDVFQPLKLKYYMNADDSVSILLMQDPPPTYIVTPGITILGWNHVFFTKSSIFSTNFISLVPMQTCASFWAKKSSTKWCFWVLFLVEVRVIEWQTWQYWGRIMSLGNKI